MTMFNVKVLAHSDDRTDNHHSNLLAFQSISLASFSSLFWLKGP